MSLPGLICKSWGRVGRVRIIVVGFDCFWFRVGDGEVGGDED